MTDHPDDHGGGEQPYRAHVTRVHDPHHDAQLLRDLAIINAKTLAELGPLPPRGLPVESKRKPRPLRSQAQAIQNTEEAEMKPIDVAAITVFGVASTLLAGCGQEASQARESPIMQAHGSQPEASSNRLGPDYKEGMDYMDFRARLLTDGWTPVADPMCRTNVIGANHEELCARAPELESCRICTDLPELAACSSDAFCGMAFSKAGEIIEITTYGDIQDAEAPGRYGLEVRGWRISPQK